jgi:endoglycosylceramidase
MAFQIIGILLLLVLVFLVWRISYRPDKKKRFLTTKDGRIHILHGMNVISAAKSDPLRVGGTTKQDFLDLSERWGFNAVRLLIFWDGIEPQKGVYDEEYLARVRERLDWCAEAGLTVILDLHQDLYSIQFGGDGAPDWAVITNDEPFERQEPWELNYVQPAVRAAINNFWFDGEQHEELQTHYINAALKALDTLADHPTVIGIDLYNEPTMATLHGLLHFERKYLTDFTQKLINTIREKHTDLWIFFEPSALGPNQGFRSGLGKLNDPREGEPRLVYFPHIYTLDLDINGQYMGLPLHIHFWAHQRRRETRRFQTPMMVGEFGLDENKPGALAFLTKALNVFDNIASGWTYWSYDRGGWGILSQEGEEMQKAEVLERPYPQKVAGTQPEYHWNPVDKVFTLSYETTTSKLPTEIYLPNRHWPEGWQLVNQGVEIESSFNEETRVLSVTAKEAGLVKIEIVPAKS